MSEVSKKHEDEIEITPEMIAAGAAALMAFDRRFDSLEEAVESIYRKMELKKRAASGRDTARDV